MDVRSKPEYTGERLHMPDYPNEGASRGGHIPTAASIPWSSAILEDETFKDVDALKAIYFDATILQMTLLPTAELVSVPATPGLYSSTYWESRTFETMTDLGPSGATWWAFQSSPVSSLEFTYVESKCSSGNR